MDKDQWWLENESTKEGATKGFVAYDIDEEAKAKQEPLNEEKLNLEDIEEINLEEYDATIGPPLKMIIKPNVVFVCEGDGYINEIVEKSEKVGEKILL